jgi:hypothetical protein
MEEQTFKTIIQKFLTDFCVKVADNEDSATTELYMDDHDCIEYEGQEYYVPQNNSSFTNEDEVLQEMLIATFSV